MAQADSRRLTLVLAAAVVLVAAMDASCVYSAGGERTPDVSITNNFPGCQPRVECAPYEDDVLFHLDEVYGFTFDVNPTKKSISCTVQCVADNSPTTKLVTFVAATRGTSTKYFVWSIRPDGGYVQWLDANKKVIKHLTKKWSF